MDEPVPEFTSVEGECAFWKAKARELKTELDEFTEDSHQLEKELEIQLKLKDDQLTDLRYKYNRQQHEIDSLQSKLRQCENELLQWEQRHKKEKAEAETLRKHTRELEQKNDDLERAHRIVSESVAEFERMLNREYEKNVMLEVEYEMEKENAQIQLQRLMDEARDLKQELKIQQKQPGAPRTSSSHSRSEDDNQHMDTRDEEGQEEELATKGKEKNEESIGGGEKEDPRKMETDDSPLKVPPPQLVNGTAKKQVNGTESSVVNPIPPPASSIPSAATLQRESSLKQMERLKNGNSMTASSRSTALAIVADLLRRVNNIDATLKELKRPKSIDDDLCETNDPRDESGGGTMREKAKSPSLIC